MRPIPAIWKDGRIVPSQPVDWPDGTALRVEPIDVANEGDLMGDDPEAIARWITAFDALPPLQMSPAEEDRWRAARREVGDHTLARMRERTIEQRP